MMKAYRFHWGHYEWVEELWALHEEAMTPREVVSRLKDAWHANQMALSAQFEAAPQRLDIFEALLGHAGFTVLKAHAEIAVESVKGGGMVPENTEFLLDRLLKEIDAP